MPQALPLKEFLQQPGAALDVRSPGEFQQGHIPGSFSFPLFNDAERAQIGTTYKKQSRQEAVELGLLLIEPKLEVLLNEASSRLDSSGKVLCWRGGMRSGFTALLLELLGYSMHTLLGGYKTYRRWALQRLSRISPAGQIPKLFILGGFTGSGKTAVLQELRKIGEQVIDLEGLANHRGSAFGGIGLSPQPTQEQFENDLAFQLEQMDWTKPVWMEDESRLIGRCHLPFALFEGILNAPLFFMQCPLPERLQNLLDQYENAPIQQLLESYLRISKRLGSQLTKEIRELFEEKKRDLALEKLLTYYDKSYQHQLSQRKVVHLFEHSPSGSLAYSLQNFYRRHNL